MWLNYDVGILIWIILMIWLSDRLIAVIALSMGFKLRCIEMTIRKVGYPINQILILDFWNSFFIEQKSIKWTRCKNRFYWFKNPLWIHAGKYWWIVLIRKEFSKLRVFYNSIIISTPYEIRKIRSAYSMGPLVFELNIEHLKIKFERIRNAIKMIWGIPLILNWNSFFLDILQSTWFIILSIVHRCLFCIFLIKLSCWILI